MRTTGFLLAALLALFVLPSPARADVPEGWHKSLQEGVEASAKSGKPILLITAWSRTL
jgi:hypothetical protein